MVDPVRHIAEHLGPGGRCLFMPNGGNLGDALIASATVQRLDAAGIPWSLIKGQRDSVTPQDVLVFGGGGSLVSLYGGGIECVASLLQLSDRVVILPQSINGHAEFWKSVPEITVFCRDAVSLAYLRQFPNVAAHQADDMAIGLDLRADPFATVLALRHTVADSGEERILHAYRRDAEAAAPVPPDTFDLPALAHPPLTSIASILANACAFLTAVAMYSRICTDRLHVAVAGGLLGIPTALADNAYGKNRAVYEASLRDRFPTVSFVRA